MDVYITRQRDSLSYPMKLETYLRQVGKNIKSIRSKSGLKQTEVHEKSGLTYRHYQNIEAGRVNVTLGTLYRLSKLFEVRIEELVCESVAVEGISVKRRP